MLQRILDSMKHLSIYGEVPRSPSWSTDGIGCSEFARLIRIPASNFAYARALPKRGAHLCELTIDLRHSLHSRGFNHDQRNSRLAKGLISRLFRQISFRDLFKEQRSPYAHTHVMLKVKWLCRIVNHFERSRLYSQRSITRTRTRKIN